MRQEEYLCLTKEGYVIVWCLVSFLMGWGLCVCVDVGRGGVDALERNGEGSKERRKCHIEEWGNVVALHAEKRMLGC